MEPRQPTSLPSGRDVLVVEDELRIRNMLAQALKEMGFQATMAPTAEAAAKAIAQHTYDILILDLNLPGKSGMEFLESVRKQDCDIQVIILTGFGDLDAAVKAIHFDVVEFLTKPCTLGSLEIALDRARKRRKGQIIDGVAPGAPLLEFETEPKRHPRPEPEPVDALAFGASPDSSIEELEKQQILRVVQKHPGNRAAMAAELGISVRKLYYRLREYQKMGLIP